MLNKPQSRITLQEALERRILHGLSCEWEQCVGILRFAQREKMRKPFFALRDMQTRLGFWAGDKREISLSRDFVLNHSWDAVCEVLLHEIAHQFAEEVLGTHHESAHGKSFHEACRILRANPRASGNYPPLDERMAEESCLEEDRIILKVKKLMALAESRNIHEAEAAMAKAHELIMKYNVDLLSGEEERHFVSIFAGKPALRHFSEAYYLSRLLIDFYFVDGIWVPAYVLGKGKMGRVLELSGTVQNVTIAAYVHDYVNHYIESRWQEYTVNKKLNRYRKTDFAVGIIEGFRSTLEKQHENRKKNREPYALIKKGDPLLKTYMRYMHPNTVSINRSSSGRDKDVHSDGKQIGKKMVISRGISEKKKQKGGLIGYTGNRFS